MLALLPSLAQWATGQIDNALAAAGTTAATVGTDKLIASGVIYDGLQLFGQGAVLVGILLGAIACFVIDRRYYYAAATSVVAAVLSFVGLVNAEAVAWNAAPPATIGYLLLAAILAGFGYAARADKSGELDDGLLFVNGTLMRGLSLHGNLAGAELLEETRTAPAYRVHSIDDVHPGMYRADDGGASISGELYAIPIETLLRVIEGEPPGLYRGPVELIDGRVVPGILFDEATAKTHPEITALGGWREYLGSKSDVSKS